VILHYSLVLGLLLEGNTTVIGMIIKSHTLRCNFYGYHLSSFLDDFFQKWL
jgi:hypothetical protein